ncbi:efflux transporter periplasmic adaptor subunit [Sulfitobacter alexandrii]|uniref:Efflux transporter periplasmic adaptor subunit n=1 Tax=Sulfitobacter alexandrii TaxID=1917485 RepID=A0A1J0WE73_9RHOB|nr:efflux RND transporter periplasmic adaptor subunit [Sulfitobacter alexandrii]APE42617.1 efflux transporter periplasmic adaptor subunit [Sulfitobacter alexandrii]
MRFIRQSMIGLFLAAATLGLLAYAVYMVGSALQERLSAETKAPPAQERVFSVNVLVPQAADIAPVIETFGEVQSRRLLELRTAVTGRVVELAENFEDGGAVEAGQVLVRLDPSDAEAAVERATSDISDAQAEQRDAERGLTLAQDSLAAAEDQAALRDRAFARQQDLDSRGVSTATATETAELAASTARLAVISSRQAAAAAEARVDQAATGLQRARIALAEAERRLADTTIDAPFSGTLSSTSVVVGRLVSANEQLAQLIDPEDLEVSFRLSTAQYARLLDGQGDLLRAGVTATLEVAGVDLTARGRISRASAAAGEGATGRLIFAALDDAAGFKTGDFVTVRVQEPVLRNVFRLPASALDAGESVLVLGPENRLEQVSVTLLRRQGDDVLVRGPVEGRQVVRERSPLLGAGIAVRPLDRAQPGPAAEPEETADMLELTEERRARLVAFVEANSAMPQEAKERVLARLSEPRVPAGMVERLESRMGG